MNRINRIYQGRITKLELGIAKEAERNSNHHELQPNQWERMLWRHHELFQAAVNYYAVCLLALATDPNSDLHRLAQEIANPDSELYVWTTFRRRGATRRGLREAVAKYLTPDNSEPSFADCVRAIREDCEPDALVKPEDKPQLLDLALKELLNECDGDGAIQQKGREMLPRFCDSKYSGVFPRSSSALAKATGKEELPGLLHSVTGSEEIKGVLSKLKYEYFANPNPVVAPLRGDAARAKLEEAVQFLAKVDGGVAAQAESLLAIIRSRPETTSFPAYRGGSINKDALKRRFFAYLIFAHVEQSELTFGALRDSFTAPKTKAGRIKAKAPGEDPLLTFGDDPIKLARGERGYVFRAFTSLPAWNRTNTAEPQWKEFDIAAFKEALKALDQVRDRGEERAREREGKEARIRYQRRQTPKWVPPAESEEARPNILAGDPRIARLEKLLDEELAEEYEMAEGQSVAYGLHPRTIRGFRDLRKEWHKMVQPGESFSEAKRQKLISRLREYQTDNPNIIGSVRLFEAFLDEANWLIWQEPDAGTMANWRKQTELGNDESFAADPLQALSDERELKRDIERLKQPVRFTPADPEYSRRQFYFSDVSDLTVKGRLKHNLQIVEVEIAREIDGIIQPHWVRLHFGAARLLRDQLAVTEDQKSPARWQPPIMEALGVHAPLQKKGETTDFADCAAVALMPEVLTSGERRFLLNFPVTLELQPVIDQLGKARLWAGQFGGGKDEHLWLHWPGTWSSKAKGMPWWKNPRLSRFTVLSVDLGQRDAGAFSMMAVTCGDKPKEQSRFLGTAGDRKWWATVVEMGMLRLPGEDARVLRDGRWQEEFYGERGRNADEAEWVETRDICEKLGLDPDETLGSDPQWHSFPELNDRLLFAFRRAQTRLARMQSWSCVAANEKRRARIREQILTSEHDELGLKLFAEKENWNQLGAMLILEIEKLRENLTVQLEHISNRILPLRGRRWEWVRRDDGSNCYVLRQTLPGTDTRQKKLCGQRGLSMKRLEQLEELRRRCQSLNRALRQVPGAASKLGRSTVGDELPDPCPELLEKMEEMREQRVNQTAHLILAQSLGVRLKTPSKPDKERKHRNIHGEYEKFRDPADFVVVEDLGRYLASQGRSRNENSRLMKWCHRQILGKLKQLATEVYGIPIVETPAAYSSRFCSRTSVPGFRAAELTPSARIEFRWRKHIERLEAENRGEKRLDSESRTESQHVQHLLAFLDKINEGRISAGKVPRTLVAPVSGGPIFVPMEGSAMQADINAAINLGLRAIAEPGNHEIHVRIRSERQGDRFKVRVGNTREKARWAGISPEIRVLREQDRQALVGEAHPNFFADLGQIARFDRGEIDGLSVAVASGRGIWGTVNQQAWFRVNRLNNDRLEKWGYGRPLVEEKDDIPM